MSQIQEWYYKGQADVSYGAKNISIKTKICISIVLLCLIIIISGFICFRNYLYDIIINPQINLTYVQAIDQNNYTVDVPYMYNFDANKFIDANNTVKYDEFMDSNNYDYFYTVDGNVDTTILGDYTVVYTSSNKLLSKQLTLNVHVIDNEPPIIYFNDNVEIIDENTYKLKTTVTRNSKSDKYTVGSLDFNPIAYIKTISDNYDKTLNINTVEYNKINWDNDNVTLTYIVSDSHNNTCSATLYIDVIDPVDVANINKINRIKEMENELNQILNKK